MEEIMKKVVSELVVAFEVCKKEDGIEVAETMVHTMLSEYVQEIIYLALTERLNKKNPSKNEQYNFAHHNFKGMKSTVQLAIADAFSTAMWRWTGKPLNYICMIQPVEDPSSKLLS